MSRSGYYNDSDTVWLYRRAVLNAVRGKRGRAFLQELLESLDAMPEKKLIAHALINGEGVCAIGSVGVRRGVDMGSLDAEDPDKIAYVFGIAPALVSEIEYTNDEVFELSPPERRWERMREWVQSLLAGEEP